MPKGIPNVPRVGASEQTQRLLEAMREIEGRLAEMRRRDKARASLVAFARKHGLDAADLREAAKLVGAREVGSHPVLSNNVSDKRARGAKLRAAREAKGLSGAEAGRKVGGSHTSFHQWENGGEPRDAKTRSAVVKLLDLPKDFFDKPKSKANGVAT